MTGPLSALVCLDARELERLNACELERLNARALERFANNGLRLVSRYGITAHISVYRKLC